MSQETLIQFFKVITSQRHFFRSCHACVCAFILATGIVSMPLATTVLRSIQGTSERTSTGPFQHLCFSLLFCHSKCDWSESLTIFFVGLIFRLRVPGVLLLIQQTLTSNLTFIYQFLIRYSLWLEPPQICFCKDNFVLGQ